MPGQSADARQLLRIQHRLMGRIVRASRKHRHTPRRRRNGHFNHPQPLRLTQRRCFARRPARHQQLHAISHLPLHMRMQSSFIDRAISAERSNQSGAAALQIHAER